MPQRKTHDVYAGNQKVGEIWESYSGKTSYEAEMGVKIGAIDLIRANATISTDEKLSKRRKRIWITYIIRAIIGGVLLLVSLYMAYKLVFEVRADTIAFKDAVLKVGILGAIGGSLAFSSPEDDVKKLKTVVPWYKFFVGLIGGFIGTVLFHLASYLW